MTDLAQIAALIAIYLTGFALTTFLWGYFAPNEDVDTAIGCGFVWPATWILCSVLAFYWLMFRFLNAFGAFAKAGIRLSGRDCND